MNLRDPRNTGRPVPFGLPAGADTDKLFATIAGTAADLLAQERKDAEVAGIRRVADSKPRRG